MTYLLSSKNLLGVAITSAAVILIGGVSPAQGQPITNQPRPADPPGAPRVITDADLAAVALHAYVGRTPEDAAKSRSRAQDRLKEQLAMMPTTKIGAMLILARGLDAKDAAALVNSVGGEIIGVEAKTPIPDTGRAMTIGIGARDFSLVDGNTEEKLEKVIGHQRLFFADAAKNRDPAGAAQYLAVAQSRELKIYRIDLISTPQSLDRLSNDARIALLIADADARRAEENAQMAAFMRSQRVPGVAPVLRRKQSDGPPPLPAR